MVSTPLGEKKELTPAANVDICTRMAKKPATLAEALKAAIADSGKSLNAIARESGVMLGSVHRFAIGKRTLRLDKADQLAAYFGIVAVQRRKR